MAFQPSLHPSSYPWLNLKWTKKLKQLPREILFLWRIIKKSLPTNASLVYKRLQDVNTFHRGCNLFYDIGHLAIHYNKLKYLIINFMNGNYIFKYFRIFKLLDKLVNQFN